MSVTERFGPERSLPASLAPLYEIAHNLWWTWDAEATRLMIELDPVLWKSGRHNPLAVIAALDATRLTALAADADFPGRRVDPLDRTDDDLDTTASQFFQRSADLIGRAITDGDPEQGRLKQVLTFAIHEHHPVPHREQLAKAVGGHEAANAASEDERGLLVVHGGLPRKQ